MAIVENNRDTFEEHNEGMRAFRKSHAGVQLVNAPRRDQPSLLESTRPLHVADIRREIGESRRYVSPEDWSALIPMWKVARYKLSPN